MHATTTDTTQVRSAARVMETQKVEPRVLGAAGGLLVALAAIFAWQELHLPAEGTMVLGAAVAAGAAAVLARLRLLLLGPVLLLGGTAAGGLWYGATREPLLLVGLGVLFAASVVLAVWERRHPAPESGLSRWHRLLSWHGVALGGLATSFAAYFHVFDASDLAPADFVARRALLSLAWLLSGVGLVLGGRRAGATEVRDAGFVLVAAAVSKVLVYDTTHLDGLLRVATLAVGGLVLLLAAAGVRRVDAVRG